ncbi:MAG: protein kinase [Chloroflexi bacterium]|nr:protein kinase [Chloroflexota bacterium]
MDSLSPTMRQSDDLTGWHLKGYQLRELVATGSTGIIYRAFQAVIERDVAIKIIRPEYANRPEFVRRFDIEAQLIARLEHPFIIPLYDYWRDPDGAYLVTRWLRGGNLSAFINANKPLPLPTVRRICDQVLAALHTAHQAGVIHRDLQPANLLLDEQQNVYLSDFGIARSASEAPPTNTVAGTAGYLAPERLRNQPATPATDIYSAGIILYELLTGQHPFQLAAAPLSLLYSQLSQPMPSVLDARPGIAPAFDLVIRKATAKDSAERFQTVADLQAALHQAMAGGSGLILTDVTSESQSRKTAFRNPYKGLRAFKEADNTDFYGRVELVSHLMDCLNGNEKAQFLAIVGPSGSGKSSIVHAGLIPAIRAGGLHNTDRWFIAEMVPGQNPLSELEASLLRVAVHQPPDFAGQLQEAPEQLHNLVDQILPDDDTELVLVIDQFEEIFTLVAAEQTRLTFLNAITAAVTRPYSRLHVIIALRADFYDRPLLYTDFGQLVRHYTEVVTPMLPDELRQAIIEPASRVGVAVEASLVEAILHDVSARPGALPLLQYTLTELFDHCHGDTLTVQAYRDLGGVSGALARRAEAIYAELVPQQQWAARQVLLRLVALGEGYDHTRHRVQRTELQSLGIDNGILNPVLDVFGQYRLLTFDYEPTSRTPTVEIAHEALLRTWNRLQGWIQEAQEALYHHRRLSVAVREWHNSDHDPSFLATGARLQQFEVLSNTTDLSLSRPEREFLHASREAFDLRQAHEAAQQARQARLERRSQSRLGALVMVLLGATIGAFVLLGWALEQRSDAQVNQQQAATTAAIARRSAAENRSLALATSARQALRDENPDLAIALALEAAQIDDPPAAVQQILAEAAYSTGTRRRYVLPAFDADITTAIYGPDGRSLLAAHNDRVLRLWSLETGQVVREFVEHDALIYGLAYSPGGRTALVGTGRGSLLVWDLITGQNVRELAGHDHPVNAVAYDASGKFALSGDRNGDVMLWDMETGTRLVVLEGHNSWINDLAFSPDGQTIASTSNDNTARIWDIETGELRMRLAGHQDDVLALAYSPDGQHLITASADGQMILWDTESGQIEARLAGHTGPINDVAFGKGGQLILSGGDDQAVMVWDAHSGEPIRRLIGHQGPVWRVGFLKADQRTAVSLSADGSVRHWDVVAGAQLRQMTAHGSEVTDVAFSPDSNTALSSSWDRTVIHWNLATGEVIDRFTGHTDWVLSVAFSPDGQYALSGSLDRTMILWEVATGEIRHQFADSREVLSVAFSPDGTLGLSASGDGTIRLWDLERGIEVRRFTGHDAQVASIAFSPDGSLVASGSYDGTVRLWLTSTGSLIHVLRGHTDQIHAVAFGPHGDTLLSGSLDGSLSLWDVESGRLIQQFLGHTGPVTGVAYSPTGLTALSASRDGTIRLWDIQNGNETARFDGHTDWVTAVAFSHDGRTALSASRDTSIRLWRTFRSLDEMINWIYTNRYIQPFSCPEREKYLILPLCD